MKLDALDALLGLGLALICGGVALFDYRIALILAGVFVAVYAIVRAYASKSV